MKLDTTLKRRDKAIQEAIDLYSCARIGSMLSTDLNAAEQALLNKRLPRWAKEYVRGYLRALRDHTFRKELVYGGYYKGKFLSTHSDRDDYYGKHHVDPREWYENSERRGFYWRAGKPFFIGEEQ